MMYTEKQLKNKYDGKYIEVCPIYDYKKHEWLYEVSRVSKTIKENCNLPEDAIIQKH